MKKQTISLLLFCFLFTATFISCSDDDPEQKMYDCTFVQNDDDMDGLIDDNEQNIMQNCRENAFTNASDIESNLIGNWELIGHGEGWIPSVSQPCAYIEIRESDLDFQYESAWLDTMVTFGWEIIENNNTGVFSLSVDGTGVPGLHINNFCSEYMYYNHTPVDGNMYLYEKMD